MAGEGATAGSQLIWCEGISKSYCGVRVQVEDADIILTKGSKLGVIGVNGAGKSTLLNILARKEIPDSGAVRYRKGLRVVIVDQDPQMDDDMTPMVGFFAEACCPIIWRRIGTDSSCCSSDGWLFKLDPRMSQCFFPSILWLTLYMFAIDLQIHHLGSRFVLNQSGMCLRRGQSYEQSNTGL